MDPNVSDPIDWGIDDVVLFLCHSESRPWAEGSNIPFPPPADLAAALHENFITGEVLLEEIDRSTLKDELGVKPLGHRSGVMKAIVWLRNRSAKYQAKYQTKYEGKYEAGSGSPSINGFNSSPQIGLSTQIPSISSGLGISAQETSLPNAPETNEVPSTAPKGKRRIVPQLIQPLKGDSASHGIPYPPLQQTSSNTTLVPENNPSESQNTLARTVTNLEQQLDSAYPQQESQLGIDGPARERQNRNTANSSPNNLSSSPKEDDFYQSLLQRYPPEEGDTGGLPLYGDSGSEGEFDEETWEEMQHEAEEHQQHSNQLASTEKQSLSSDECMSLIDQHVTEKESHWKDKRLPRELPKASGIWEYSHAHGTLEQDKKRLTKRISLYQRRLEKLKGGLLQVEFTDRTFFLQSCASLDPTITDLCLDKWTLEVLNLDTQPPRVEKPPKVSRPKPARSNSGDDESLASETDTDIEDDDMASGSTEAVSEDEESEFMEIDSEKLITQNQAEKPHKGLPFTLDSPTPEEEEATSTEPSRKRRRLHDESSGDETSSETGLISEFLRRGDIDTVDLTGNSPTSNTAPALSSNVNPSIPVRQESMQNGEDADEMQIETPPLNPTHLIDPQDNDVEELSVDNSPQSSLPKLKLRLNGPHPLGIHTQHSRQIPPEDRAYPKRLFDVSVDALSVVDEDDVELFDLVKTMDIDAIALSKNRVQLLAKLILGLRRNEPKMIRNYLDDYFLSQILDLVHEALIAMCHDRMKLPDRDENENTGAMRLAALYHSWHHCIVLNSKGLDKQLLRTTISHIENIEFESMFKSFIDRLSKLFTAYSTWIDRHPDHSPHLQKGSLDMSVAMSRSSSSSKTKSKTKFAPRAPSSIQREAQLRQEKQEAMRQEREKRGLANSDPDKQAVTFKEPVIYLPKEIGEHVKPHQLAGIQFMWRELIEAKKPQGCLLAHVMGLGKTMQVISLLATIADAASSDNPKIREQVPEKFHRSRTLILCPSAVVQNWADEFALWAPRDHHLGPIWEIISGINMDAEERFLTVKAWDQGGGVLIISYDLFRILVLNKSTRPGRSILPDEQHEMAREALLSRPNIVVADEAHRLKNEKSAISQVTSRFKTLSRIAMTGSPLANHLSEYYQMVDWVAPGYLESALTFKNKFVDPIQSGSYLDSTPQQQRESLCALKILNGILKPKVLRADTSVIATDLPSKTEFVIRIPLTDLQKAAYNTFVSAAQAGDDVDARLYSWLAILQLCCNHPQPFREKLADRAKQPEDNEGSLLPGSMCDSGLPSDLLTRIDALFQSVPRIEDPNLSYRATLLNKILDESIKLGDKVLIFTQSVPTLNYIHLMLTERRLKFQRIDGNTPGADRQTVTKRFNTESDQQVLLISTKAGGVGLNMFGANRVVIFDFLFNPTWEDQAIGRAYRLGQTKPVFVYRFVAGGTFEENIFNKAVFKRQLAVRVVDKKNVVRQSHKNSPVLLHEVQEVKKEDHAEMIGKDKVLDKILTGSLGDIILDVSVSRIQDNENDRLTKEESLRVDDELKLERLKRSNPRAFEEEMKRRHDAEVARYAEIKQQREAAYNNMMSLNPMPQNHINHVLPGLLPSMDSHPNIAHEPTRSPALQHYPGIYQTNPAIFPSSAPVINPLQGQPLPQNRFAHSQYTPSATSLAPDHSGLLQIAPKPNTAQQPNHSDILNPPGTNYPVSTLESQTNSASDGPTLPVEVIDLATPSGPSSPNLTDPEICNVAPEPGQNGHHPRDKNIQQEAGPTQTNPTVPCP